MIPRKFKYVIIDDVFPRICSPAHQHKDLVRFGEKATSAGFAEVRAVVDESDNPTLEISCYGESIGLKLKSSENDRFILERLFSEPA